MEAIPILDALQAVFFKILLIAFMIWMYKELTMGICKCKKTLSGQTIVMTGGSRGLGFEAAVELAKKGAKLILGCRTDGRQVIYNFNSRVPDAKVICIKLDLSSNHSILKFVEDVMNEANSVETLILGTNTIGR